MSLISRAVFALLISAAFAGACRAQEGIPLPPFEPPVPEFVPPVMGHPVPGGSNHGSGSGGVVAPDPAIGINILIGTEIAGFVVIIIALVVCWRGRKVAYVRVIDTPPGEAPEPIRRAWVGVKLPLRRWRAKAGMHRTEGVLSQQVRGTGTGYAVNGRAAVMALASHSPEAAAWWRANAPHVLAWRYRLWFPSDVCEPAG